jgi:hypothetical protein
MISNSTYPVDKKENAKILSNNLPVGLCLKLLIPPAFVSNCFRK